MLAIGSRESAASSKRNSLSLRKPSAANLKLCTEPLVKPSHEAAAPGHKSGREFHAQKLTLYTSHYQSGQKSQAYTYKVPKDGICSTVASHHELNVAGLSPNEDELPCFNSTLGTRASRGWASAVACGAFHAGVHGHCGGVAACVDPLRRAHHRLHRCRHC